MDGKLRKKGIDRAEILAINICSAVGLVVCFELFFCSLRLLVLELMDLDVLEMLQGACYWMFSCLTVYLLN